MLPTDEIYVRTDCFAYDTDKRDCTALKRLYCRNEKCNFYKPKDKFHCDYAQPAAGPLSFPQVANHI